MSLFYNLMYSFVWKYHNKTVINTNLKMKVLPNIILSVGMLICFVESKNFLVETEDDPVEESAEIE